MLKEEAKTCWEYWECKVEIKEKCPAYKSEKPCWHVAGQYCGRVIDKHGIEKCFSCEWFRLNHPRRYRTRPKTGS